MRWFGNQHIFELGWRGVYIAASCNLENYPKKGRAISDSAHFEQFTFVLRHFRALRMISAEKGIPCAG